MTVMTPKELSNLVKYKYNGGDRSYIYKYILSPWAEYCVDTFIPKWVAPNLITFGGLLFSLCSFICVVVYNPSLESDGPRWLGLITAINLFIYQTLDNMDGKQARKTGTSSPLGMLFDHGVDAINTGLLMIPICSAMGTGQTRKVALLHFLGFLPFFTQTWEEYYREELVIPVINGPSEGLLIIMGICTCSYLFGSEYLHG
ncbi:captC, partial [Symbiodinium microadriaticum]